MKRGKNYVDSKKLIDPSKLYEGKEAIELLIQTAKSKFDETMELHAKLGVDLGGRRIIKKGVVVLPNGTGKKVRVLAIVKGENIAIAKEAGADFAGAEEMVEKIQKENWFDYDVIVTTPDMMGLIGRLGKVLGPKGLMPNPKSGTVSPDIKKAVSDIKAGKVEYRVDKQAIIHVPFGKKSFGVDKLLENYETLMEAIVKAKPVASKGIYLRSLYITSTMGPSIRTTFKI